jgi:hypothetical protein
MIIDIHAHVFPDEIAERAVKMLAERSDGIAFADGTCAGLLASMQKAGIDRSAIMPIATKPSQVESINRWMLEIREKYPEFICFAALHPARECWKADIERIAADGFPGVKLHPDYQEFFVDDPQYIPMYKALADHGLILLFHAGDDVGLPPPVHCTPDRLARVLDAVPEITIIAAHMGGYLCWDDVYRYLVGRNLYFDTSYSLQDLGAEPMTALMKAHGIERILFGTDSPWTDQASSVREIRDMNLTESEIVAVLGGNSEKLLGLR